MEKILPIGAIFSNFIATFAMSTINCSRSIVLGFCNIKANGRIRTIGNREM